MHVRKFEPDISSNSPRTTSRDVLDRLRKCLAIFVVTRLHGKTVHRTKIRQIMFEARGNNIVLLHSRNQPTRMSVASPAPGVFHDWRLAGQHASVDGVLNVHDRHSLPLRDQFSGFVFADKPVVCLCYPVFKRPSWIPTKLTYTRNVQ